MAGTFRSLVVLATGAVLGGVALLAYRISQETGKPFQEAIADVPAELNRLMADVRARAADAIEKGRALYEDKQQELAEQLKEYTSAQ
jgi:hypothetical protein